MMRRLLASLTLILVLSIVISAAAGQTVDAESEPMEINSIELNFSMTDVTDDNDALFRQYINRVLSGQSGKKRRTAPKTGIAGAKLTKSSRLVYDFLHEKVELIANGFLSSTIIEVPSSTLGMGMYTAEELGVSELYVETDEGLQVTSETLLALFERDGYENDAVFNALRSDCPYDLYWYDKTVESSMSMSFISGYTSDDVEMLGISSITFFLCVAEGYQQNGNIYMVDSTLAQAAISAKSNITTIIAKYANQSDLNKLKGYKDEICALTSYNTGVANNNIPYGDPWQLIWVFDDEDPEHPTNVVCEGYSKAFKYLCDNSSFDGNISCILVSGTMFGGTGAGPHMWNIVKMPNNKNYLVDITNCDEGSIGYPDILFLVGYSTNPEQGKYVYSGAGNITYIYDSETLSTFNYDMWLAISNKSYIDEMSLPTFDTPDFVLPQHIQTIGSEAFSGADPSVVKIPALSSGNQTIQDSAFAGCTHLRQIFIPASVTSIGTHAFDNCAEGLIIFGEAGSAAENYASANEILFVPVTTAP